MFTTIDQGRWCKGEAIYQTSDRSRCSEEFHLSRAMRRHLLVV
jgi:hypothetical protein